MVTYINLSLPSVLCPQAWVGLLLYILYNCVINSYIQCAPVCDDVYFLQVSVLFTDPKASSSHQFPFT